MTDINESGDAPSYQELVEAIVWWDKVAHYSEFSDDDFEVATAALTILARRLGGLA